MNGNNNKKPGMGNQGPTDRRQDGGRGGDTSRGGDNRPRGNGGDTRKPSPGMPSSGSYRPDIRGGNNGSDKMKGDKCPDCGNMRSKCSC